MALIDSILRGRLSQLFGQRLNSIGDIAARIADSYQVYCSTATGSLSDPVVLLGAENLVLRTVLSRILSQRLPGAAAAQEIGSAVQRYWTVPPIKTAAGGICASILVGPGVGRLMSARAASTREAADNLSAALEMMTKTVIFSYPPPIPPGKIL